MIQKIVPVATILLIAIGCSQPSSDMTPASATFGDDLAFLRQHTSIILLTDSARRAQVAVSPAMQGRVLTSSAAGESGLSYGWINREVIASGERQEHINVFGGEDRFWLGPEGGQYSVYFAPGVPFELDHWFVPAAIDWDPFETLRQSDTEAVFAKDMELINYSGTVFDLSVRRTVRLLTPDSVEQHLGMAPSGLSVVAFESENVITNTGEASWGRESGLLSIWILGMFTPTPQTTVIVPYIPGSEDSLGAVVNADYFGRVPEDRLKVEAKAVFFKGDGTYRSKIGFSYARSTEVLGSYDAQNGVLTIVQFNRPEQPRPYVNSMWEIQDNPYQGDVINSYNDGPPEPGVAPLGPFYELETSSPAAELKPGESLRHVHRTMHLEGDENMLSQVAQHVLGHNLERIATVFEQ